MFPEIDKEKTGDRIRFYGAAWPDRKDVCKVFLLGCVGRIQVDGRVNLPSLDNIYCLSILFKCPDAMVCESHIRENGAYRYLHKALFGYYKKIRNRAAA